MTINPYQSTIEPVPVNDLHLATSVQLFFDGVIDRNDYSKMLPNRTFLWWLQLTLLAALTPALLGGVSFALITFFRDGPTNQTLMAVGVNGVLLAIAAVTIASMGRACRSRFYLSRFPDLIGPVRGEFNSNELLMHDGKRKHWFGPTLLSVAVVTKAGIRVPLPGSSPYRYLAFTERIFLGYLVTQAKELQTGWKNKAARRSAAEPNPVANLWTVAASPPASSVGFKGYCSTKESLRSRETMQTAIIETVSAMIVFGASIYFIDGFQPIFWGAMLFSLLGAWSSFRAWKQYFFGFIDRTWYQYGWLSEKELAFSNDECGTLVDGSEITSIEGSDKAFSIVTQSGTRLFIFREHVADDANWQRLGELCACRPSFKYHHASSEHSGGKA